MQIKYDEYIIYKNGSSHSFAVKLPPFAVKLPESWNNKTQAEKLRIMALNIIQYFQGNQYKFLEQGDKSFLTVNQLQQNIYNVLFRRLKVVKENIEVIHQDTLNTEMFYPQRKKATPRRAITNKDSVGNLLTFSPVRKIINRWLGIVLGGSTPRSFQIFETVYTLKQFAFIKPRMPLNQRVVIEWPGRY